MKQLFPIFFILPLFAGAQGPEGGCSITLVSAESTTQQGFCVTPVNVTIEPIVYVIQGTGFAIEPLPPGVTATLVDDTLTIAGTITTPGVWSPDFSVIEGCWDFGPYISVSQIVDPGLTCTVVGDSITVSWPGLEAPGQYDGTMFLFWTDGADLVGNMVFFLPCPGSVTVGGLPTNTPITFYLSMVSGNPNCFNGDIETTCTIISAGIDDAEEDALVVRAVPRGNVLELSAPVELNDVRIYDMLGGLVASQSVNARTASVPIASLAPGAFLLRILGADGRTSTQRFVKEQ
ncbi:MAG: T9SS type A sorting domain-containing protein [Flavobacteriales bacterium]|nr:T9SS type A sorting domain-containing protein [Flavobacteriales bacterium]